MSQHPSLKSSKVGRKIRTVLKRYERFFKLREKDVLKENSSVFAMPKLKIVRTKIKKEKAEEKPGEEQTIAPAGQEDAKQGASPKAEKKEKKK